jgi:hypothetical protein
MERIREASPRLKARIAGVLYLIIIVAASFAELFVRGRLVVGGDAGATATNILAHEPLYLGLVTVGVTERKSVLLCIFSNPRALTIELILLTLSGYRRYYGAGTLVIRCSFQCLRIVHQNGNIWWLPNYRPHCRNVGTGRASDLSREAWPPHEMFHIEGSGPSAPSLLLGPGR